jgi:hypothetical protein
VGAPFWNAHESREPERTLSSNTRNSASAKVDVMGEPIGHAEQIAGSVIHAGNPPMVPSGNSPNM